MVSFTPETDPDNKIDYITGDLGTATVTVKKSAATLTVDPATVTVTKDDPATINVSSTQVGEVSFKVFDVNTEVGSGKVDVNTAETPVPVKIPTTDPRITAGKSYRVEFTLGTAKAEANLTVNARVVENPFVDYSLRQEGKNVKIVFSGNSNNYGHGQFKITINGVSVTKTSKLSGGVNFKASKQDDVIQVPTAGGKMRPATHGVTLVPKNNSTLKVQTTYEVVVTPADDATKERLQAKTLSITMGSGTRSGGVNRKGPVRPTQPSSKDKLPPRIKPSK